MGRRKGFTLIEVIVVVAITGFMLLITVVGYNNVTNAGMKTQLWRAERIVELAIAHVVQSGRSISTGYYSVQSFYNNYNIMLPMNPLIFANEKTGISTANQWYIVNNSGVYTIYPVGKNGSYAPAFGVVANNDVPFLVINLLHIQNLRRQNLYQLRMELIFILLEIEILSIMAILKKAMLLGLLLIQVLLLQLLFFKLRLIQAKQVLDFTYEARERQLLVKVFQLLDFQAIGMYCLMQ